MTVEKGRWWMRTKSFPHRPLLSLLSFTHLHFQRSFHTAVAPHRYHRPSAVHASHQSLSSDCGHASTAWSKAISSPSKSDLL
jgi:hypothetical protein